MIMAAMSIVVSGSLMIAPTTAIAPMMLPPVEAIRIGIRYTRIAENIVANPSWGIQPLPLKKAARKPNAINAPIFGMIIADKNLPKRCTLFFI